MNERSLATAQPGPLKETGCPFGSVKDAPMLLVALPALVVIETFDDVSPSQGIVVPLSPLFEFPFRVRPSTQSRMPSLSSSMSWASWILSPSVSSASRKSLSILSRIALLPSPPFKSPSESGNAIDVASRFSSLTSKPSVMFTPSSSSARPSPSASFRKSSDASPAVPLSLKSTRPSAFTSFAAKPASTMSDVPSLSLSKSR